MRQRLLHAVVLLILVLHGEALIHLPNGALSHPVRSMRGGEAENLLLRTCAGATQHPSPAHSPLATSRRLPAPSVHRVRGGGEEEEEEDAGCSSTTEEAARASKDSAKDSAKTTSGLRESAKRRLQNTRKAERSIDGGLFKMFGRMFFGLSTRMGITGASTRVVNGKIILSRNPIQSFFHLIYIFLRAIYLFLKTLFVPLKSLDAPKPSSGPGRGSFANTNRKREMRMADLPPMPGG